ncbi:MAG: hypothetical protein ACUVR4_05515, partial [Anaerolineae bacterium]
RLGEANVLFSLGELARQSRQYVEAENFYRQALALQQQIQDRLGQANTIDSEALRRQPGWNEAQTIASWAETAG